MNAKGKSAGFGRVSRRRLFRSTAVLGLTAAIPSSLDRVNANSVQAFGDAVAADAGERALGAYSEIEHSAFMHGVASGDPLPSSVIIWTRVTPTPEATPGSGVGPEVRVGWEISEDPSFARPVRSGQVAATAASDHTIHVDPHGLAPQRVYFYRFTVLDGPLAGSVSQTGRTKTAPAPDVDPGELRLAVSSCANFEAGYFRAYSAMAEAARNDEIDVVVHMGDYIYEYANGASPGKYGVVRPHVPTWELTTRQDYRARYGNYRRDVELQSAHAAAPWVVTWDDHEIANDAHQHGAANHGVFSGSWESRRDAAMGAYLEWLPVRGTAPSRGGHIYRSLRFGTLAELHMLDLRSYRSAPGTLSVGDGNTDHTIMGSEQFDWLSKRLNTASTRWNLIGTSVMMAPMNLLAIEQTVRGPLAEMLGVDESGGGGADGTGAAAANLDQWDGYEADRRRLLSLLAERHPHGRTVFVTGDIHSEWANHIVHNDQVVAAEMVCSSVNAPNVDDMLSVGAGNPVSRLAEEHVRLHNPHVKHVDLDAHGFARLRVTRDGAAMQWWRVDDVTTAGSEISPGPEAVYDGAQLKI